MIKTYTDQAIAGFIDCSLYFSLSFYLFVILFFTWLPIDAYGSKNVAKCEKIFYQKAVPEVETSENKAEEIDDNSIRSIINRFTYLKIDSIYNTKVIEDYFVDKSPLYKAFRENLNPNLDPYERVLFFLKKYFQSFLNSNKLDQLREKSLENQLTTWGAPGIRNFKELKKLSEKNVQQVLQQFQLKSIIDLPQEVQAAIDTIDFQFRHNTDMRKIEGPIMLSSARLNEVGLTRTLQNSYSFNSEDVKSGDQLYFYVQPSIRLMDQKNKYEHIPSRYGNGSSIYLNEGFAEKRGWISPYIMTVGQLMQYKDCLKATGFDVENKSDKDIIKMLHLNVYTTSDFTKLYKTIFGNYLVNSNFSIATIQDPSKLLHRIQKGHYTTMDATSDMAELMKVFGISGGLMELKVPVAIESKYLIHEK